MEISLAGKTILITGGTSPLGSAFVKKALKENARVFFTYHANEMKATELISAGAKGFCVDLSQPSQIESLKAKIKSETDVLDGLIHNAAIVRDHTLQNMAESEWDEVLNVNLKSVYLVTKALLRFLLKKEHSKIIMVISHTGLHGAFGQSNYAAAKGGLIALTRSLAREIGKRKILVNAVSPGFMRSTMTSQIPKEIFESKQKESVLNEISNPEEVADFLVYLMSDRVQRVSGQVFHYDSRVQW